jgi:acetylornithine/succinyldiaminopimelate/putrescine aminotransferase
MGVWSWGIPENQAQIIVCENNFHGRTTTIVSFSNDEMHEKALDHLQLVLLKFLMIQML